MMSRHTWKSSFIKYLVLEFVRDAAWAMDRVEQLLNDRSQHAKDVADVYLFVNEYLQACGEQGGTFHLLTITFLQEMFVYQDKVARHYADGLDGCGLDLEAAVRRSFYALARRMIAAVCSVERFHCDK